MKRPIIFLWDNSANAFVDLSSNVSTNTDFNFLSDANDKIYIGLEQRHIGLYCDLTTAGSYTGLSYSYLGNNDTFKSLALIDNYTFTASKYQRWILPEDWIKASFTTTFPHTATPPDNVERYWIRISCSAITTTAVINKIRSLPFVEYTNPTKISEFLQLKEDFDNTTIPTDLSVEYMIKRAEDRIDYRTRKSWRFNVVTETTDPQLVDYNRYGVFLRHKNFLKVYSVKLWNGSSFDTLTEGRTEDYFINYDLGMIYFTRLFLLPATYGMSTRYALFGQGEFKNALQIDYAYGRNSETDSEFYIVEDIATKLAAKDLLKNTDYSKHLVSGVDNISYSEKARLLEDECEQRLDELIGIALI